MSRLEDHTAAPTFTLRPAAVMLVIAARPIEKDSPAMSEDNSQMLSPEQIEKAKAMGLLYYEIGLMLNLEARKRKVRLHAGD